MAVSAGHLIASAKRLPKQFQPFVMETHKRTTVVGESETSTLGIEVVALKDSGPLARLFDDYEKQRVEGCVAEQMWLQTINAMCFLQYLPRAS